MNYKISFQEMVKQETKELIIILEDLHDENVLQNDMFFSFIDTVFYLTEDFYKPVPDS